VLTRERIATTVITVSAAAMAVVAPVAVEATVTVTAVVASVLLDSTAVVAPVAAEIMPWRFRRRRQYYVCERRAS
jgi:hypothetical protein